MSLEKYLKKIGVKSYLDLNSEERETYKSWEAALSGRRLTDEDVKTFLHTEKEEILKKLPSQKLKEREDTFLKMKLEFIQAIERFLDGPRLEKEMVEKSIEQLVEKS